MRLSPSTSAAGSQPPVAAKRSAASSKVARSRRPRGLLDGSVEPSPDPAHTNNTQQANESDDSVRRQCRNWYTGGDCCISDHDKAGRSAVQPIRCCVVEAILVRIDHDIISAGGKRGMPDEHRGYIAIHDRCGLDRTAYESMHVTYYKNTVGQS